MFIKLDENNVAIEVISMEGTAPSGWLNSGSTPVQIGQVLLEDGTYVDPPLSLEGLRAIRDRDLVSTDWRDLPSYQGTDQEAWRALRQALRDVTEGYVPVIYVSDYPIEPGAVAPVPPTT